MKKWILILTPAILLIIYVQQQDDLVGKWKVNSEFYQATYQIIEAKNQWKGLVLYYNDGTTKYTHDKSDERYAFTGLTKDETTYVDGISGATSSDEATPKTIEINQRNKDTLDVTSYVMNKPLVEIWTREQ